jgi:hypothetical protein
LGLITDAAARKIGWHTIGEKVGGAPVAPNTGRPRNARSAALLK